MTLHLTPDQSAAIRPHMRPGTTLLALITREMFDGANADRSGALTIQFGAVPNSVVELIRKKV